MDTPANPSPPYKLPVFWLINPTTDGPKNPPRFPTELMTAIPLAAENPVRNSLGIAQKGQRTAITNHEQRKQDDRHKRSMNRRQRQKPRSPHEQRNCRVKPPLHPAV